jgi:hypothetical protein
MTTREALHALVDRVPEDSLAAAERALADIAEPRNVAPLRERLERAPYDDEPLTADDVATIERGKRSARAGDLLSREEAERFLSQL